MQAQPDKKPTAAVDQKLAKIREDLAYYKTCGDGAHVLVTRYLEDVEELLRRLPEPEAAATAESAEPKA